MSIIKWLALLKERIVKQAFKAGGLDWEVQDFRQHRTELASEDTYDLRFMSNLDLFIAKYVIPMGRPDVNDVEEGIHQAKNEITKLIKSRFSEYEILSTFEDNHLWFIVSNIPTFEKTRPVYESVKEILKDFPVLVKKYLPRKRRM